MLNATVVLSYYASNHPMSSCFTPHQSLKQYRNRAPVANVNAAIQK